MLRAFILCNIGLIPVPDLKFVTLTNIGDFMSINNAVTNVIPDDIRCQDSLDNQLQAFLAAMKDILETQCLMIDKNSYVERRRVKKIRGARFKVISKT